MKKRKALCRLVILCYKLGLEEKHKLRNYNAVWCVHTLLLETWKEGLSSDVFRKGLLAEAELKEFSEDKQGLIW